MSNRSKSNPSTPRCFDSDLVTPRSAGSDRSLVLNPSPVQSKVKPIPIPKAPKVASGESSQLKVTIRIRPLSAKEANDGSSSVISVKGNNTICLYDNKAANNKNFVFDSCFDSDAKQQDIYENAGAPLVDAAVNGYHCCLLTYGQTGSGKTYTMMGLDDPVNEGVIPRIAKALFARLEEKKKLEPVGTYEYHFEFSFIEIYAEKIYDLMKTSKSHTESLKLRYTEKTGPYVEGMSKLAVLDFHGLKVFIDRGNTRRTTASTDMNARSSRSHAVIMFNIRQLTLNAGKTTKEVKSTLFLVDLAGSEKVNSSGVTGVAMSESVSINLSLSNLSRVIAALIQRQHATTSGAPAGKIHVPYRNSTLTFLLMDAFAGNAKTTMIATLSPASINMQETQSTLRYMENASQLVSRVKVNESSSNEIVLSLQKEIEQLRKKLEDKQSSNIEPESEQMKLLQEEISTRELIISDLKKEWSVQIAETKQINIELKQDLEQEQQKSLILEEEKSELMDRISNLISEREKVITAVKERTRVEIEEKAAQHLQQYDESNRQEMRKLMRENELLHLAKTEIDEQLAMMQKEYNDLSDRYFVLEELHNRSVERRRMEDKKMAIYTQEIADLKKDITDLKSKNAAAAQTIAVCQSETKTFKELYNQALEKAKEFDVLQETLLRAQSDQASYQVQLDLLDKQTKEMIKSYESKLNDMRSLLASRDEDIDDMSKQLFQLKTQEMKDSQLILDLTHKVDESERKISILKQTARTASEQKADLEAAVAEITTARQHILMIQSQLDDATAQIERHLVQSAQDKRTIEQLNAQSPQIEQLSARAEQLTASAEQDRKTIEQLTASAEQDKKTIERLTAGAEQDRKTIEQLTASAEQDKKTIEQMEQDKTQQKQQYKNGYDAMQKQMQEYSLTIEMLHSRLDNTSVSDVDIPATPSSSRSNSLSSIPEPTFSSAHEDDSKALQAAFDAATSEAAMLRSILDKIKAEYGDIFAKLQMSDSILSDKERQLLNERHRYDSLSKQHDRQKKHLADMAIMLNRLKSRILRKDHK